MSQVEATRQAQGVDLPTARKQRRAEHRQDQRERRGHGPGDSGRRGNLVQRLAQAYVDEADPITETLLFTWTAFGATFGAARLVTHGIRGGWLPFVRNVTVGAKHLHHYNWGIVLLAAVGLVALRGSDETIRHPYTGVAYGVGSALIADEAALLLELEDVYWTKQGHTSVDVAVGIIAALGTYVAAAPFWDNAVREVRRSLRS
jgi:hypothetical protein